MRVMLIIKGDPQPGAAPSEELLGAIGRYNDELKEAGVLIDLAAPERHGEAGIEEGPSADRCRGLAGEDQCQDQRPQRSEDVRP